MKCGINTIDATAYLHIVVISEGCAAGVDEESTAGHERRWKRRSNSSKERESEERCATGANSGRRREDTA